MKLLPILVTVLGEVAIGTSLFVCLQQTKEIRKSFFSFQSWLAAICFLIMALAVKGSLFYRSPYFSAALFSLLAARSFSNESPRKGKILLIFAALLSAFLLIVPIWNAPTGSRMRVLGLWNILSGTLLFGWANGSMILGHWYLIMRDLSFSHFQRATLQLLVTVGFRIIGVAVALLSLYFTPSPLNSFLPSDTLFLGMRLVWGLLLPGIFSFMAWRCARTGSNQAGTGLLYIGEVAVLIGEILAGFIGF